MLINTSASLITAVTYFLTCSVVCNKTMTSIEHLRDSKVKTHITHILLCQFTNAPFNLLVHKLFSVNSHFYVISSIFNRAFYEKTPQKTTIVLIYFVVIVSSVAFLFLFSAVGVSLDSCALTYCGESAGSEPEAKAVMDFVGNYLDSLLTSYKWKAWKLYFYVWS